MVVTLEPLGLLCSARRRSKQLQSGGQKNLCAWEPRKPLCLHSGVCPCMYVHALPSLPLQLGVSHLLGKMSDAVMDDIIDRSSRELTHERRDTSCLCLENRVEQFLDHSP